jgi:putative ABC transport system permease protein
MDDVAAISDLPLIQHVAPESSTQATLSVGSLTWTAPVSGTVPALQDIKDWPTRLGGFITEEDLAQGSLVAVIGQTVVDNLYTGAQSPVGSQLQINGLNYTVIGVLTSRGAEGSGSDQDNSVYIPITTAQQRLLGSAAVRTINIQAVNTESLEPLKNAVTTLLRQRHRLADSAEDDFMIQDMAQVLSTIEDTTRIFTFLLGGIAAVSLLVGGIGIMNIMLVSVTERTREIGVRMAVGATPRAIMTQFLIEALLLCIWGGIIGVLLGWGGSSLLGTLADLQIKLSPWLIAVALGFSLMVGLFFGYYPASKAARSNPIEALRFE